MRPSHRTILLLALVGTAVAVPALAQPNAATIRLTYADTCDAAKVTKADTDKAIKLYNLATDFIKESNYDNAIDLLKRAYDTDCRAVELLLGLASVFERAGNRPEAVRALEEYLKRVPNPPDKDTIDKRIRNLGGPSQPSTGTTATVSTGTTTATVTAPTATTTSTSIPTSTATATATATTTATTETHGPGAAPWVVVGIGGAALIAGVVMIPIGAKQVSDADKTCNPNPPNSRKCTNPASIDTGNNGRTLETVGGVVAGVGAAAAAAGILWYVLAPRHASPTVGVTTVTPTVAPGFAGMSIGGRF